MSKEFSAKGLKNQVFKILVDIARNSDKKDAAQMRAAIAVADRLAVALKVYEVKLASPIGLAETNRIPAVEDPEPGPDPFTPKMTTAEAYGAFGQIGGDNATANQSS